MNAESETVDSDVLNLKKRSIDIAAYQIVKRRKKTILN